MPFFYPNDKIEVYIYQSSMHYAQQPTGDCGTNHQHVWAVAPKSPVEIAILTRASLNKMVDTYSAHKVIVLASLRELPQSGGRD